MKGVKTSFRSRLLSEALIVGLPLFIKRGRGYMGLKCANNGGLSDL